MKWAIAGSLLVLLATVAGAGLWLRSRPPPMESWVVTYAHPSCGALEPLNPVEHALLKLPGLRSLREDCLAGEVTFEVEAPPETDVRAALNSAQAQLQADVMPPTVTRVPRDLVEERFVVTSDTMTLVELSRWAHDTFELELERLPGVREVEWCGLVHDEVQVKLDLQRVRALGQNPEETTRALSAADRFEDVTRAVRDVASVSLAPSTPACLARRDGRGVLFATVRHHPENALTLPTLPPSVTLERVGAPVEVWLAAEEKPPRLPGLVLQRGHRVTAFTPLDAQPGLELLRRTGGVAVQVLGPRPLAKDVAEKLRAALANEPGWTGALPLLMLPVKQAKADRPDATRLFAQLVGGRAGQLADGTPIVLKVGDDVLDATLADGTPLSMHVTMQLTEEPESTLRLDGQPALELFTNVEHPERVVQTLQLPPGVQVRVAR